MSAALEQSESAILERVFDPSSGWTVPAAQAILNIGFAETDRKQMIALLEKAKAGTLLTDEAAALDRYRYIGRLLELMKSKARRALHQSEPNLGA